MKNTWPLPLLIIAVLLSGCGRPQPQPEAKERKMVISPSGQLIAKIAVLDLGPDMRLQQVYVMPTGVSVKFTGHDSAGMIAAIVEQARDENFDVRWVSEKQLLIEFRQDRPAWANYVPVVQGVGITLKSGNQ